MRVSLRRILAMFLVPVLICSISGTRPNLNPVSAADEHTFATSAAKAAVPKDPFVTNNGLIPPASEYQGPMFTLSSCLPTQPLPPMSVPPWQKAIGGGRITTQNAGIYVEALKQYVSANARVLLLDYANWDAAKAGWSRTPSRGLDRSARVFMGLDQLASSDRRSSPARD